MAAQDDDHMSTLSLLRDPESNSFDFPARLDEDDDHMSTLSLLRDPESSSFKSPARLDEDDDPMHTLGLLRDPEPNSTKFQAMCGEADVPVGRRRSDPCVAIGAGTSPDSTPKGRTDRALSAWHPRHNDEPDFERGTSLERMIRRRSRRSTSSVDRQLCEEEEVHDRLRERILELEADLAERDAELPGSLPVSRCTTARTSRKQSMADKDAEIHDLRHHVAHLEESIEDQEQHEIELRGKLELLEAENAGKTELIATLRKEVRAAAEQTKHDAAKWAELWGQAESQRRDLADAKDQIRERDAMLSSTRQQWETELSLGMRERNGSLASMSAPSRTHSGFGTEADTMMGELENLRDELSQANEGLADALQAREESARVQECLLEELGRAYRKAEEQEKIIERVAESERKVRRQITDITSRRGSSARPVDNSNCDSRLLRARMVVAEEELNKMLEMRDDVAHAESQVQNDLFQSSCHLQQELDRQGDMVRAEQELRGQVLGAQREFCERLSKTQACTGDADTADLMEQLEASEAELRKAMASIDQLAEGERRLREQVEANSHKMKEQYVDRSIRLIREEELRDRWRACKDKLCECMAGPDGLVGADEVVKVRQGLLDGTERQLDEVTVTHGMFKSSQTEVRQQVDMSNRRLDQQLEARDGFTAREKYLLDMVASLNLKLNAEGQPNGATAKDEHLKELRLRLDEAKTQLKESQTVCDYLLASEAGLKANVQWMGGKLSEQDRLSQLFEKHEKSLREDVSAMSKRLKGFASDEDSEDEEMRDRLSRAERQLRELLSHQGQDGETEMHLRARLARAHWKIKDNVPVVSLRIPSLTGADEAGGGAVQITKVSSDRARMRRQLGQIRSELRDVASALLEDMDARQAESEAESQTWIDTWFGSATQVVCCRPDSAAPRSSSPNDRRRDILVRLCEHLEDDECEATSFDTTSFDSTY